MANGLTKEKIKVIGQIIISLGILGGGIPCIVWCPDLRDWGSGFVGAVVGYWLR